MGRVGVAIECDRLSRRFGDLVAVDGLTLRVEEGEFFTLLGPNGAGKSTTLHMLTTLLAPTGGRARVFGYDLVRQASQVRRQIGVVFQEPALDERLTARENLEIHAALYGIRPREVQERVQRALEWAQLEEAGRRLVRTFSGGMKRRLELARALMHEPRLLILDEPTLGLDPQARRHLWSSIRALKERGLTLFVTTHYLEEAEASDRVAIMDRGKVVAVGEPGQLKEHVLGTADGSLEDVFLTLTGRQLRDEEATGRDRLLIFARRGGEHTR